mmetsp:Transcript_6022/g.12614  ORF Transcript_6022/g.12614 Transcript_6022/m.12614 type:complete len:130 (+) Transcript_6022:1919-2308(+)
MLKYVPGETHIVLTGKGPKGTPLMAIGYRYSSKSKLFFVCTKDSSSTRKGKPYKMKFTDTWGNVCVRLVNRPDVISQFFEDANVIDIANHVRQFELALETMVHPRPILPIANYYGRHRCHQNLSPFKIS